MNSFWKHIDKEQAKKCLYWVASVPLAFGLCLLVWYSSGYFLRLWMLICAVCKPIVVGGFIAYLLQPGVQHISVGLARLGFHPDNPKRRVRVAVLICLTLTAAILVALVTLLGMVVTHSLNGISFEALMEILERVQSDVVSFIHTVEDRLSALGITLGMGDGIGTITGAVGTVRDFFSNLLFGVIFAVYFLLDEDNVRRYVEHVLYTLLGAHSMSRISQLIADADRVFSGYIRGQLVDATIVGSLTAVSLSLLKVPYGSVIGLLTGIGNLIPYVGGPVGYASIVLACLIDLQLDKMVAGIVCLTLIMLVDSNVINPKLLSESVQVHPLLVIAALIGGGALGGIIGMLVAVPVAAFLKLQVDRWLERKEVEEVEWADF